MSATRGEARTMHAPLNSETIPIKVWLGGEVVGIAVRVPFTLAL